jgi:hypothetical protein
MQSRLLEVFNWRALLPSVFVAAAILMLFFRKQVNMTLLGGVLAGLGALLTVVGAPLDSEKLLRAQEKLTDKQTEISVLAQQNLAWVTGGSDEFVQVQADFWTDSPGTVSFGIHKFGKYPAYDMAVTFTDVDARTKFAESYVLAHNRQLPPIDLMDAASVRRFSLPIVYPDAGIPRAVTFPYTGSEHHSFTVEIFARNGHAGYNYKFVLVNGQWLHAMKMERSILGVMQPTAETIPPNFPRNSSGKIDW